MITTSKIRQPKKYIYSLRYSSHCFNELHKWIEKKILPLSTELLCGVFYMQELNLFILHSLTSLLSVETLELVAMLTAMVSLVLFSAGFVGFCCWKHPSIRTRTYWDKQTKKILRALYSEFLNLPNFWNYLKLPSGKKKTSF